MVKKSVKGSVKEKIKSRPPIVAVLGHVDHGKTSLISKIYQQDLNRQEHGGISQHIGAYQIKVSGPKNKEQMITFIDTPGHVTFAKMRSRGAKVADLAILVVAADEGVKPQTLESLKHIQAAKIPYLVAINKIDLPDVRLEWVKGNLAENEILVEGYGGDIVVVPVSAKTGKGLDQLLEMILLLAEMAELKGNSQAALEAVVIESQLDKNRGPVATVLVRNGCLRTSDEISLGTETAKIKALFNEFSKKVDQALPGQPVEILGFHQVPSIGAQVTRKKTVASSEKKEPVVKSLEVEGKEEVVQGLKIILKTDVTGTLEAILESLSSEVKVIESGVGQITESDIFMAATSGAEIIGFNIKLSGAIKKLAESEGVKIKTYSVVYELLEEIEKRILKILEPTIDEEVLGEAEILAEFEIKGERIAGARMKSGRIAKQNKLHLKRGKKIVADAKIKSLKTGSEEIDVIKKDGEFGVVLSPSLDFKVGDMLVSYRPAK